MEAKEILGKRLKQARQKENLSMEELSSIMDNIVSKQTISKYESGKVMPSDNIIIALSNALSVPFEYFFKEFSFDIKEIDISFRKKASVGKKEELKLKAQIQSDVEKYLEIERILGIDAHVELGVKIDSVKDFSDMTSLAQNVRNQWGWGELPISNAAEMLMTKGIKVFQIEGPDSFDGVSGKINDNTYIVVINSAIKSTERRRFTTFHELAHLLANKYFDSSLSEHEKETLCHVFASELLLPSSVLKTYFANKPKISYKELEYIQSQYGLSLDAIMHSLKRNKIISDQRYRSYCIRKNKELWLKQASDKSIFIEAEHKLSSISKFETLVYSALSQNLISVSKAAEMLDCKISQIRTNNTPF